MKTEKSTQNHFKIIQNFLLCCFKKPKECVLRYRFRFLGGAAAVGIVFALGLYLITHDFTLAIDPDSRLATNLTILLLSLPVFCLLWFFRTHDTKEQIQKTQANINTSMLHKAIDLALAKEADNKNQVEIDRVKRAIGLKMLAQLKRTNSEFEMQIDFVTKGLDLNRVNLVDADLRGVDLQEADLQVANLQGAYLQDADLRGANLLGANLIEAKLQGAYLQKTNLQGIFLQDADLRGAYLQETDLIGANLRGAHYDSTTRFPPDFNPQDARMIKK